MNQDHRSDMGRDQSTNAGRGSQNAGQQSEDMSGGGMGRSSESITSENMTSNE